MNDPHDDLSPRDARVLDQLTRDSRVTPPPVVDFDRLEASLFAKLENEPVRLRPRARSWVGALALAAAAAGVLFIATRPSTTPVAGTSPVAKPAPTTASAPAEHFEIGGTSRSFSHEGLAAWVLEPGTIADVGDEGERVVVTLRAGAVRADVVPQLPPREAAAGAVKERFIVIVDQARVAVRGTSFRVARAGDKVEVDVERGVVVVGALDAPPRWTVAAPLGGTFRSDASAGELRPLLPFSVAVAPPSPSPKATASSPRAAASEKRADVPEPRVEATELRARATALASECFQRSALPANVHVTVDTTMKLVADERGGVTVTFDPPLAPGVEACVRDGVRSIKAQTGALDAAVTLVGRK